MVGQNSNTLEQGNSAELQFVECWYAIHERIALKCILNKF